MMWIILPLITSKTHLYGHCPQAACLLGAGSAQPQFPPPDSAPPLGPGPPPAGGGGGGGQCGVDIPNMMDECCGMANEGCCVGGQVSCDWWRADHVTPILLSDWCRSATLTTRRCVRTWPVSAAGRGELWLVESNAELRLVQVQADLRGGESPLLHHPEEERLRGKYLFSICYLEWWAERIFWILIHIYRETFFRWL